MIDGDNIIPLIPKRRPAPRAVVSLSPITQNKSDAFTQALSAVERCGGETAMSELSPHEINAKLRQGLRCWAEALRMAEYNADETSASFIRGVIHVATNIADNLLTLRTHGGPTKPAA